MTYSYEEQKAEEQRLRGLLEHARADIEAVKNSSIFAYTREHVIGELSGAILILDNVAKELRPF